MPGQAIIGIRDREWQVTLATTPWEQAKGLGGIPSMPSGTGMFFDIGYDQVIAVTTVPMLFPLDIAFISDSLMVVDVGKNVPPGLVVSSGVPARFFLEVNAGELEGIDTGDRVYIQFLPGTAPQQIPDWVTAMFSFMGFAMTGMFMVAVARVFMKAAFAEPEKKPVLYGPRGEKLLPQTKSKLKEKWYEKGVEAGKTDGWMAVEDTLSETLRDHRDIIRNYEDLVWTDVDLWEETEHFNVFYGSKMWKDALEAASRDTEKTIDVYFDLRDEFWEGYLTGRKQIGIDIYRKASELVKSPKLMPQTGHERKIRRSFVHLPFAGAGKEKLWWLTTIDHKTITAEVTGIHELSQKELEDAFANSWATVSLEDITTASLPFAAVSKERIWWVATINARTIEVKVTGIRGLSEIQLEDAFADSTAKIYNLNGLGHPVIPPAMKERESQNLRQVMRGWAKEHGETPWSEEAKETFKLLRGRAKAIGLSDEEFEKLWAEETEHFEDSERYPRKPKDETERKRNHYYASTEEGKTELSMADKVSQLGFSPEEFWALCEKIDEAMLSENGVMWLPANKRRQGLEEKVYPLLREFEQKYGFNCPINVTGVDVFQLDIRIDNAIRRRREAASQTKSSAVIPTKKKRGASSTLEYFADSPELLTQTVDSIGYREKIDKTFQEAIARAKGLKQWQ